MRPPINVEDVSGENLTGKQSLAAAKVLWNEWEIHCLIVVSLALQVFLFVTAPMRRRSTSRVLRTVLWLAYLSADFVAIFVLGHLAVHASDPQHQLLLFWAPFLLVHLGGQDTITALSVQDNELWRRHLLGLVYQVAVAGYVVSKSSWPDGRLRAAMILMFLSGSFKYAGRTICLYAASPGKLRDRSVLNLSMKLSTLHAQAVSQESIHNYLLERFKLMFNADRRRENLDADDDVIEIVTVDAPSNREDCLIGSDALPGMHQKLFCDQFLYYNKRLYEHVGGQLVLCYQRLYTKRRLLVAFYVAYSELPRILTGRLDRNDFMEATICSLYLIATLFQYLSSPIALVLFRVAEKGDQLYSRADVTVSYILLIGATVLDAISAFMSIFSLLRSDVSPGGRIKRAILRVADYIQDAGSSKQWSEELAQYSMIKRYTIQDTAGISSVWQWIDTRLNPNFGVKLLDPSLTHTPVTDQLKEFVLRNMLLFGASKQYKIASSRGQLALQKWTDNRPGTALQKSIKSINDEAFPTSVLIWHIATDICYYSGDNAAGTDSHEMKKKISRELSNYIMYLVFKCDVMLTSNSRLVHHRVHDEIRFNIFAFQKSQHANLREKEAVMKMFEGNKDEQPALAVTENDTIHQQDLARKAAEAIYTPVLPRAREVAQELIGIHEEAGRWDLIAEVWLGMLYYTAPRCGGAFHYQHLSTGGEFITHVLLLMYFLGPFLPPPGA